MRISKVTERWFTVPNDPDKSRLKIKHLLPGEAQDIFDQVFKQKVDYQKGKEGKMEPKFSQESDPKLDRKLTFTSVVVGWENMFDDKGQKMKCTPENIERAYKEIDGFSELVNEFKAILAADIKQEQEDQKKNLKSSVSELEK